MTGMKIEEKKKKTNKYDKIRQCNPQQVKECIFDIQSGDLI